MLRLQRARNPGGNADGKQAPAWEVVAEHRAAGARGRRPLERGECRHIVVPAWSGKLRSDDAQTADLAAKRARLSPVV